MAKTPMRCPFNEKLCKECQIYRGRHYYLCTCKEYRGYIDSGREVEIVSQFPKVDMSQIKRLFEPWTNSSKNIETTELKVKIKLIDREAGTEKYYELSEAKDWDWENKFIMRLINGKHVTSWEEFLGIIRYFDERGIPELIVYEAPVFMLA